MLILVVTISRFSFLVESLGIAQDVVEKPVKLVQGLVNLHVVIECEVAYEEDAGGWCGRNSLLLLARVESLGVIHDFSEVVVKLLDGIPADGVVKGPKMAAVLLGENLGSKVLVHVLEGVVEKYVILKHLTEKLKVLLRISPSVSVV